jgi:hypothetical protein
MDVTPEVDLSEAPFIGDFDVLKDIYAARVPFVV